MTDIRMQRARAVLIRDHAFFGSLAMHLECVEDRTVERFSTDGNRLRYNPEFLDTLTEPETQACVGEVVLHCALGHHTRMGARDLQRWNKACDYVVWNMLLDAGFTLPQAAQDFLDPSLAGLNAEQVYKELTLREQRQEPEDDNSNGDDDDTSADERDGDDKGPGDGNSDEDPSDDGDQPGGSGGQPTRSDASGEQGGTEEVEPSSGFGDVTPAAPAHDQATLQEAAEEWEVTTRQAVNVAKRQDPGNLPGFIQEIVKVMNEVKVDWRQVLRRFVEPSNTKDYSWTAPNRRMMSMNFYVPGIISDGVAHLGLAIDTSASMDSSALEKIGGEVQALLDEGAVDKVTLLFADTRVNRTAEYVKGETIDFSCDGRGGTAFAPTFEWINEQYLDIRALIYFTDLECWEFGVEPDYPVLWAQHGHYNATPPFGEVMQLPD